MSMASASCKRETTLVACASKRHKLVSQSEESKIKDDGIHRFSELPDDVLVHILSFLPTLDAVGTVVLRPFHNLWTLLPSLCFDDDMLAKKLCTMSGNDMRRNFSIFIFHVLKLHQRPNIDRFDLRLHQLHLLDDRDDGKSLDPTEVNSWISFAVDCQVKALDLQFDHGIDASVLSCVFTSQFLVTLKLSNCVIEHLSEVHMGCLRELSLIGVYVGNKTFKDLISGCPSLRNLFVEASTVKGLDELCITTPSIENLDATLNLSLLDCPNVKILNIVCEFAPNIVDVSSVSEATIQFRYPCCRVESLLAKFRDAKVFTFSTLGYQNFKLEELDFVPTRWKHLYFQSPLHVWKLLGICKLLRYSPELEELTIYAANWREEVLTFCGCDMKKLKNLKKPSSCSELSFPCMMPQLRVVIILGYQLDSCPGLLLLVEFLLRSAVNLEKLVIIPNEEFRGYGRTPKFKKRLERFLKASFNEKIVWEKLTTTWKDWLERKSCGKRFNVKQLKHLKKFGADRNAPSNRFSL